MPKYISFLFPFDIRNIKAPYLWMMYKQLEHNNADDFCFIGSEEYFLPPENFSSRWEKKFSPDGYKKSEHIPHKYIIDKEIFNPLRAEKITDNYTWKSLIEDVFPPFENRLKDIFEDIVKKYKIEAVFTLCNCATLEKVAADFHLPVIHVELGALRRPSYINTGYFDFSGCNGHTECEARYKKFAQEKEAKNLVMTKDKILQMILRKPKKKIAADIRKVFSRKNFELGIPQQIEDDSNILAYSNGFSNFELLSHCKKYFSADNILVRRHPRGKADYKIENIDKSANSKDFISRCKNIATINSSVGLEAMLYGKDTWIFGDNPFKFIAHKSPFFDAEDNYKVTDAKLSFAIFGYLIPFDLMFNQDYISFRLSSPSESQIYKYHLDYWKNH